MMVQIAQLNSTDADFQQSLDKLLAFENAQDDAIDVTVAKILADVRSLKNSAMIEYTNRFDRLSVNAAQDLELTHDDLQRALTALPIEQRTALQQAADRIRNYHEKQLLASWQYQDGNSLLGQKVTPLDRVGLYVPGGKASYPSSVLMNAIPAKVAGVKELIMVVPTPDRERNDMVLAAAAISQVDRVFTIGGAQAIGALAYGTETIPQVDKIVGPGNAYVAAAKRRVFGVVGIDMVAGPSEILVICDGKTNPDWIVMDLFSQAEHDEMAQSILLCPDQAFLQQVGFDPLTTATSEIADIARRLLPETAAAFDASAQPADRDAWLDLLLTSLVERHLGFARPTILCDYPPSQAALAQVRADDPLAMYLSDIYTVSANLAGVPAISVPCGLSQAGLPIGLQLVGNFWSEDVLLNLASAYETAFPLGSDPNIFVD